MPVTKKAKNTGLVFKAHLDPTAMAKRLKDKKDASRSKGNATNKRKRGRDVNAIVDSDNDSQDSAEENTETISSESQVPPPFFYPEGRFAGDGIPAYHTLPVIVFYTNPTVLGLSSSATASPVRRRPMYVWFLYRQEKAKEILADLEQRQVMGHERELVELTLSSRIAKAWKDETLEVKDAWEAKAMQAEEERTKEERQARIQRKVQRRRDRLLESSKRPRYIVNARITVSPMSSSCFSARIGRSNAFCQWEYLQPYEDRFGGLGPSPPMSLASTPRSMSQSTLPETEDPPFINPSYTSEATPSASVTALGLVIGTEIPHALDSFDWLSTLSTTQLDSSISPQQAPLLPSTYSSPSARSLSPEAHTPKDDAQVLPDQVSVVTGMSDYVTLTEPWHHSVPMLHSDENLDPSKFVNSLPHDVMSLNVTSNDHVDPITAADVIEISRLMDLSNMPMDFNIPTPAMYGDMIQTQMDERGLDVDVVMDSIIRSTIPFNRLPYHQASSGLLIGTQFRTFADPGIPYDVPSGRPDLGLPGQVGPLVGHLSSGHLRHRTLESDIAATQAGYQSSFHTQAPPSSMHPYYPPPFTSQYEPAVSTQGWSNTTTMPHACVASQPPPPPSHLQEYPNPRHPAFNSVLPASTHQLHTTSSHSRNISHASRMQIPHQSAPTPYTEHPYSHSHLRHGIQNIDVYDHYPAQELLRNRHGPTMSGFAPTIYSITRKALTRNHPSHAPYVPGPTSNVGYDMSGPVFKTPPSCAPSLAPTATHVPWTFDFLAGMDLPTGLSSSAPPNASDPSQALAELSILDFDFTAFASIG